MAGRKRHLDKITELEQSVAARDSASTSAVIGVCDENRKPVRCYRIVNGHPVQVDDESDILIPLRMEQMLNQRRYIVMYGGRGSGKTRSVAAYLVERARTRFERILCAREIQKSIADSSYQEIVDEIERRGLEDEFKIIEARISHLATGSTFSFEGLFRNVSKIKGYAGASIAWVEEAENISQKSWDVLTPTIRSEGSQIIVTFNPVQETDPTYTTMVAPYVDRMEDGVFVDENNAIINVNYTENPWVTPALLMERDKMRATDMDRYLWIWEGKFFQHGDAQVMANKWAVADFDIKDLGDWRFAKARPMGPYFGADFGYSTDPNTLVRCWVYENTLYIDYAIAKVGVDIDGMGDFYLRVPEVDSHTITADSARPETIAHLRKPWVDENGKKKAGFNMRACKKWPGSVEDGIAHIRSYNKVIIHPRCKPLIDEAQNYKYKVDPLTDMVTNKIVDAHNHCWDAVRYALGDRIGGRGGSISSML